MPHRHVRPASGFTLIEVMVVVAIIGILAAIAYPAYTEQVAKGRRADAKASLAELSQWLERRYTMNNSYLDPATGNILTLPSTRSSTNDFYDYSFMAGASAPTANSYWLQAVPKGSMASDRCGTLQLGHTGSKQIVPSGNGTVAECWNK